MGSNPFVGVIYHWIGGFASATNFIPFRGIRRWSWEIYWLIQGMAAWIVAPSTIAFLFIPHFFSILLRAPHDTIMWTIFWGMLWGAGSISFGLSIRYLGLALGYAIALGFCTAFGTLLPPLFHRQLGVILHERSGQVVLAGVGMCLLAIAVNGTAGYFKEHELSKSERAEAGERDYNWSRGLTVAVFAGIMSSFFAVGLDAGKPIADIAKDQLLAEGRLPLWQNLPTLVVVLWGGFLTNFVWSVILILHNRSAAEFLGAPGRNPLRSAPGSGYTVQNLDLTDPALRKLSIGTLTTNYLFAALAGILWYFQFFFYSMGQTKMGRLDFSSWTLHMASIILFATLWGLLLKEWKGTTLRTRMFVAAGVLLLLGSTVMVGAGNYLKEQEGSDMQAPTHSNN